MSATKPSIEDTITVVAALRIPLSELAGRSAALSTALRINASRLRRNGEFDLAITDEQCADEARAMGIEIGTVLESIDRVCGKRQVAAPMTRHRTGEWKPPAPVEPLTPEETIESMAETQPLGPISDIAEANANDKDKR